MKRIILPASLVLAGLVGLVLAREPMAIPVAPVLQHATDKAIDQEIRSGLMPLQIRVTPHIFSRRIIPDRERIDYYLTVQPTAESEVIPFSVVKYVSDHRRLIQGLPAAPPMHFADARLDRKTKVVTFAWVNPRTGKREFLPAEEWLKRRAPAS